MSESNRQSDLAVMDANEYKQKHRLRQILEALDEVETSYQDAKALYVSGQIDEDAKNIRVMYAVQRAIRETINLIDDDHEIWADRDFGKIPRESQPAIQIDGLNTYMVFPEFEQEVYERIVTNRNGPNETEQEQTRHTMPEEISERVFLALKTYLNDKHDLDIAFEELDDKLADERPNTMEIPEGYDIDELDSLEDFEGVVDARAVKENGD